jgi:hypothetical protein
LEDVRTHYSKRPHHMDRAKMFVEKTTERLKDLSAKHAGRNSHTYGDLEIRGQHPS